MTARDLIRRSLMLIGVLAEGETASADALQDGLSSLNDMLGSWSTEGLTVFNRVREEFTLTPGTAAYTIGVSGTFNTSRPLEIEQATLEDQSASPTIEMPIEIISLRQWSTIAIKDMQSTYPLKLYIEMTNPLAIINLWPVPSAANKLVIYSRKPLSSIASANTAIALPPGYDKALRYNLAIELAPEYGKATPPEVMNGAIEAKANIKRQNIKPSYLECDAALVNKKTFNILSGQ